MPIGIFILAAPIAWAYGHMTTDLAYMAEKIFTLFGEKYPDELDLEKSSKKLRTEADTDPFYGITYFRYQSTSGEPIKLTPAKPSTEADETLE